MHNSFKPVPEYSILENHYRWCYLQLIFQNVLGIFCGINLLNCYVERFSDFGIDGSLLHAPHAPGLKKRKDTNCHESNGMLTLKEFCGDCSALVYGYNPYIHGRIPEINNNA